MPLLKRAKLNHGVWSEVLLDRETVRAASGKRQKVLHHVMPSDDPENIAELHGRIIQRWLADTSWVFCESCLSVSQQEFGNSNWCDTAPGIVASSCAHCLSPYVVPDVRSIPLPLRNLHFDDILILRPLTVHLGEYNPGHAQGYRRHTAAIRFSWKSTPVIDAIAELSGGSFLFVSL